MCEKCESSWEHVTRHGGDVTFRRYEPGGLKVEKIDTYASGGKLIRTKVPDSPIYGGPVTITYNDAGHVVSVAKDVPEAT